MRLSGGRLAALVAAGTLLAACTSTGHAELVAPSTPTEASAGPSFSVTTGSSVAPSTSAPAHARLRYQSGIAVPDPKYTPGSALPGVTATDVCTRTWNAAHKTISYRVQNQVSSWYDVFAGPGTDMHFDQLIPAVLGGDATARNVWPQPTGGKHPGWIAKNKLEWHLRALVCQGQLSLATAQHAIIDWPTALAAYPPLPVSSHS